MTIRSNATGGQFGELERNLNHQLDSFVDEAEVLFEEVFTDVATEAKTIVGRSGVYKTVSTGDGRGHGGIENDIDSRVRRVGDRIVGQAGFVPTTIDRPRLKILGWQESGTRGLRDPEAPGGARPDPNNRGIRPMFAIKESSIHGAEALRQRWSDLRRGIIS